MKLAGYDWMRHVHGHLDVDCQHGRPPVQMQISQTHGVCHFHKYMRKMPFLAADQHSHRLADALAPSRETDPEPEQRDLFCLNPLEGQLSDVENSTRGHDHSLTRRTAHPGGRASYLGISSARSCTREDSTQFACKSLSLSAHSAGRLDEAASAIRALEPALPAQRLPTECSERLAPPARFLLRRYLHTYLPYTLARGYVVSHATLLERYRRSGARQRRSEA